LKEEALDRTVWRARFGRSFGSVVRQTTKWMNELYFFIKTAYRSTTVDVPVPQLDKAWSNNLAALNIWHQWKLS
jgi:hypothetical protein